MIFSWFSRYDFLPRFLRLSAASILANMLVPVAGLVDAAFLGHLTDLSHLTGVILAAVLFEYLYRVLNFLRSSTNGMTAQAVGQNNREEVIAIGLRSAIVAVSLGIIILLFQYPLRQLGFALLAGTPEVKQAGFEYFNVRIWAAPAVLLNFATIGWFLGREMGGRVLLLSLAGHGSHILLDYLFVVKWNWETTGAGLSTAISQYIALFVGLILACSTFRWYEISKASVKVFNLDAFQGIFAFNGNILVRTLVLVSTLSIFTNLSSLMGTLVLAENGLLLQILTLSHFAVQGIGFATQSFTGQFKAQQAWEKLGQLLAIAIVASLAISLPVAGIAIFFPYVLFGLLTNHVEVIDAIYINVDWLLPLLIFNGIGLMLEGYFIGLTEGIILRNSALISIALGFVPLAVASWYLHDNQVLWSALCLYMFSLVVALGIKVPKTLQERSINLTRGVRGEI
jgi:MATE family multidrug resistance protein